MKKTSLFILMATATAGAITAKSVSPFDSQHESSKVALVKSNVANKSTNNLKSATTTEATPITVVEVVSNSISGIQNAKYTATLDDGTVLVSINR